MIEFKVEIIVGYQKCIIHTHTERTQTEYSGTDQHFIVYFIIVVVANNKTLHCIGDNARKPHMPSVWCAHVALCLCVCMISMSPVFQVHSVIFRYLWMAMIRLVSPRQQYYVVHRFKNLVLHTQRQRRATVCIRCTYTTHITTYPDWMLLLLLCLPTTKHSPPTGDIQK